MMIGLIVTACVLFYAIMVIVTGLHMSSLADDRVVGFVCAIFWPFTWPFFCLYALMVEVEDYMREHKKRKRERERQASVPAARVVHQCTDLNCERRGKTYPP